MGCEAPPEALVLELKFKGSRKEYYRENPAFPLEQGDYCIVAAERGRECGKVVEKGLIASLRAGGRTAGEVLRAATAEDMTVFWENAAKEERARTFCLGRISTRRLEMKLADVEWQATGRHRFRAVMVSSFAALAVILAMVGVFGILAYSVQQRVRDFGVRRATAAPIAPGAMTAIRMVRTAWTR